MKQCLIFFVAMVLLFGSIPIGSSVLALGEMDDTRQQEGLLALERDESLEQNVPREEEMIPGADSLSDEAVFEENDEEVIFDIDSLSDEVAFEKKDLELDEGMLSDYLNEHYLGEEGYVSNENQRSRQRHSAYFTGSSFPTNNSRWLTALPDHVRLSELSIPGTHNTVATRGTLWAQNQTVSLPNQLRGGIRFLDIRARAIDGVFAMHHGSTFMGQMFGDVLCDSVRFLRENPNEVIFMRLQQTHSTVNDQEFNRILSRYLQDARWGDYFYHGSNRTNPTLGDMRGRIVIFRAFLGSNVGIRWPNNFNIQDNWNLNTNWDLYDKWEDVRAQLRHANRTKGSQTVVNFLSGSNSAGRVFPHFVASGHSSMSHSAPRLATGLTHPGWRNSWPSFPRVNWFLGIATIAFEGTNILTYQYIQRNNLQHVGIIVADYPGHGLINRVINLNQRHLDHHNIPIFDGMVVNIISELNRGMVIDMSPSRDHHVHLWQTQSPGVDQQEWAFVLDEATSTYTIQNLHARHRNGYLSRRANGHLYFADQMTDAARWRIVNASLSEENIFNIVHFSTGKHLDITASQTANGTRIITYREHGSRNQQWHLNYLRPLQLENVPYFDGGTVEVVSALNGTSVLDRRADNTNPVVLWNRHGKVNQRWHFQLDSATNTYFIQSSDNRHGSGYLAENNHGRLHFVNQRTAAARWHVVRVGMRNDRDVFHIINAQTENLLDITNAQTGNGTVIQTQRANGNQAQKWYLIDVSEIEEPQFERPVTVTGTQLSYNTWYYVGNDNFPNRGGLYARGSWGAQRLNGNHNGERIRFINPYNQSSTAFINWNDPVRIQRASGGFLGRHHQGGFNWFVFNRNFNGGSDFNLRLRHGGIAISYAQAWADYDFINANPDGYLYLRHNVPHTWNFE